MKRFVYETDLATINRHDFDEVFVGRAGEESGIAVWTAPQLAPMVAADTPARATARRQLIVVVDDPDSLDVRKRVQKAIGL